jgi:ribosomal RNA small subunit methyltransferase A
MLSNRKLYGQNFLVDPSLVCDLVDLAQLRPEEPVYEIGSGMGILTKELARRVHRVISFEIDPEILENTSKKLAHLKNVSFVSGNFLEYEIEDSDFVVFANLPFNLTTAIVRKLVLERQPPRKAWLLVEEGAAKRLAGVGPSSVLSCLIQAKMGVKILRRVNRHFFRPIPRVDGSLIELVRRKILLGEHELAKYQEYLNLVFKGNHKTLRKNLRGIVSYDRWKKLAKELGLPMNALPSDLTSEQHLELFCHIFTRRK